MWESTNSNPPGPVGMLGKLETGSSGQIKGITLLSGGVTLCCALYKRLLL